MIRHRRRHAVPTILQQSTVECGAACLAMILAWNGRWVPLHEVRAACDVSRDGSSALDLARAAADFGLEVEEHRLPADRAERLPTPAILWWNHRHFVVLEGVTGNGIALNDPARGRLVVSREDFASQFSGFALTFAGTPRFVPGGRRFSVIHSVGRRLRNSKSGVVLALLAGALAMVLGLVIAPVSEAFIDGVLVDGDTSLIAPLAGALMAIALLRGGLMLLEFGTLARIQTKFTLVSTVSLVDRLLRLPIAYFLQRDPGDLSQRAAYSGQVATILASQLATAFIAVLGSVGYAVVLVSYDALLAACVVGLSAINLVLLGLVMRRRVSAQTRMLLRLNDLRGATTSTVHSIETIKATGAEDEAFQALANQQSEFVTAQSRLATTSALLAALPTFLFMLTSAVVLVVGSYLVMQGELTLGQLFAVQALALGLNVPLQALMSTGSQMQTVVADLECLDEIEEEPLDPSLAVTSGLGAAASAAPVGRLTLVDVHYAYSRSGTEVLGGVSLDLLPGRRIAVVGPSGGGKSTLANVAAGLLPPTQGTVLFDGAPITGEGSRGDGRVAKVDQTIVLFEGTVRENLTLWDAACPDHVLLDALEDACVAGDVLRRPGGLDAMVEEDGRNFSGGQRQRLEIARALATRPRILILDEATNALDEDVERTILRGLRRRGIATLVVAHRLSTVRDSDEILVLDRGVGVVERGNHADLMSAGGLYASLVNRDVGAHRG